MVNFLIRTKNSCGLHAENIWISKQELEMALD